MQIFLLILCGFLSGIFAGMGMGGGTVLVPLLSLLVGLSQRLSQAINLIVFLPVGIVSTIVYAKQKLIDFSVWWKISLPASVVAIVCAVLSLKTSIKAIKIMFAAFLIVFATVQIFSILSHSVINFICKKNK